MKKINLFKIIIFTLSLAIFSCDGGDDNYKAYDGSLTSYLFKTPASNLASSNSEASFVEFVVGVTSKSSAPRTISFDIDPESTATADMYTIDPASLIIPAGEYSTTVKVLANFDNIPVSGNSTLILNFASNLDAMPGSNVHTVTMFRFCSTNLAGNYNVTTTYEFHDFLSSYPTNTTTATLVAQGVNTYKLDDFSGGLYSTGPYASQYGTGAASQAGNRDLVFSVNCGSITWSGQSDPWGAIIPQANGVNAQNSATQFTLSWECLGYGEKGVSVYTKI